MPRTNASSRHPALVNKERRVVAPSGDKGYGDWQTLSQDMKRFLLLRPGYGTHKAAAEAIGRDARWFERSLQTNPMFRRALDGYWSPHELAMLMGQDLVGLSMLRLDELIDGAGDKRTTLSAIAHLHRLLGYGDNDNDSGLSRRQTYINAQNITMFEGVPSSGQ